MNNVDITIAERMGRFVVPAKIIMDDPLAMLEIMSHCIIVRCEHLYVDDVLEYVALSPLFELRSFGQYIPYYVWEINVIRGDDGKPISYQVFPKRSPVPQQ